MTAVLQITQSLKGGGLVSLVGLLWVCLVYLGNKEEEGCLGRRMLELRLKLQPHSCSRNSGGRYFSLKGQELP